MTFIFRLCEHRSGLICDLASRYGSLNVHFAPGMVSFLFLVDVDS